MFGFSKVKKKDIYPELNGTDEGNEEIYYNFPLFEFKKVLLSEEAKPIEDEVLRKISIMSLHDSCYNLTPSEDDNYKTHSSLYPVAMKEAYNIQGDGCLLSMVIDEYVLLDIGKYTRLSLGDWLHLTFQEQKLIKKSVEKKKTIENNINNEIIQDIKDVSKVDKNIKK